MPNVNLATVKRYWDAIDRGDTEAYLATFAKNGIANDPANKPGLRTAAARRTFIEGLFARFPRRRFTIDFMTGCGDSVAVKWSFAATGSDGAPVHAQGIDISRHADDGLIEELWAYPEQPPSS
ncbi:MAG: steroid Delta-isomerase [Sphingomonadales bacterium]|jgi:ketosteroid isomerase-like protein|nr:steroid Delta-isomerase [Sphingomonadales bacterium]